MLERTSKFRTPTLNMGIFGKLFKQRDPSPQKSEPAAPTSDPATDPNLIRVFDQRGQEVFISKDESRKNVLPGAFQKHWTRLGIVLMKNNRLNEAEKVLRSFLENHKEAESGKRSRTLLAMNRVRPDVVREMTDKVAVLQKENH